MYQNEFDNLHLKLDHPQGQEYIEDLNLIFLQQLASEITDIQHDMENLSREAEAINTRLYQISNKLSMTYTNLRIVHEKRINRVWKPENNL